MAYSVTVNEGSSLDILFVVRDADDVEIVPDTLTWSLYSQRNAVINSRSNVAVAPIVSSGTITLSGADLPYLGGQKLYFVMNATYDSDSMNDRAIVEQVTITVAPIAPGG